MAAATAAVTQEAEMRVELTRVFAEFVVGTASAAIPAEAFDRAAKCIVDTVGCILAGSASELAEPMNGFLHGGTTGSAVVIGTNLRTSPELAAMVNGSFGHALDFDDTLSMMPAHPSTVILPALFSGLKPEITGRALVEAYIIGLEMGAKLGLSISNAHYRRGFHATGTLAIFSAISALARLHGIGADMLRNAYGIGASMASGVRCNFGTMTKPFHAGWAAHNAVMAVTLARCGMSASTEAMEAEAGFYDAYGTEQSDMAVCAAALGHPWVLLSPGMALKQYPCIYALHRPIDALLQLREELSLTPENVDFIECRMAPGVFRPLLAKLPTTGLEGKFSMDYVLAVAALGDTYDLGTFSDAAVGRASLAALYPRMRKFEDPACLGGDDKPLVRSAGTLGYAQVTVRRKDGLEKTLRIDKPRGSPELALTWDDLDTKFVGCGHHAGLETAAAQNLFTAWRGVETAGSAAALVDMLARS
jgi:2-methylcitrate dehydratase PrpD